MPMAHNTLNGECQEKALVSRADRVPATANDVTGCAGTGPLMKLPVFVLVGAVVVIAAGVGASQEPTVQPGAAQSAAPATAAALRARRRANVIYGTVRLIECDDETFLVWARERYACVIFNLHVDHTPEAIGTAADAFRELIDLAIRHGGSYYLTYHRWARQDQVERCYPRMREFLLAKRRYDPVEIFQSEWYRYYRRMFV